MKVLAVALLAVAGGLAAAAVGAYVGAGHTAREIAAACVEREEARIGSEHFGCSLAPGWSEVRR